MIQFSILSSSVLLALCLTFIGCEQPSEMTHLFDDSDSIYIAENYEKREYQLPMRDGTKLYTAVYTPKKGDSYPILLYRTPYGNHPYGEEKEHYRIGLGPGKNFLRDGYIFVYQDVRGRYMSEGEFVNMRPHQVDKSSSDIDESTDTYDTVDWLIANLEKNNGKVGIWGVSYPGFYTSAGIIDTHPAIKAASPQAPIADWWYDDFYHNGAFFLQHAFRFFSSFGQPHNNPTPSKSTAFDFPKSDAYNFFMDIGPLKNVKAQYFSDSIAFWDSLSLHPNYDDFWTKRNILPHLKNIQCAVLTVGGWYDAEDLYGPLATYNSIEINNPTIDNTLVMGPWYHGAWIRDQGLYLGDVYFEQPTSQYFQDEILFPFFSRHLKGVKADPMPEAFVFETGTNKWQRFDEWPPKNTVVKNFYLKSKNVLSLTPPSSNEFGADPFISDPNEPVPYTNYNDFRMPRAYMVEDQSHLIGRDDVLYYQTAPLEEAMTVAGPIEVNLQVLTSQTDADWIVKLIDVYPKDHQPYPHQPNKTMEGYQQLIRMEALRGRFRNSRDKPEPFESNKPTKVTLSLPDILHTFKPGHRLMVQIQSTAFPLIDRNPQRYVENIFEASQDDFVEARHVINRSGMSPSYISMRLIQ